MGPSWGTGKICWIHCVSPQVRDPRSRARYIGVPGGILGLSYIGGFDKIFYFFFRLGFGN